MGLQLVATAWVLMFALTGAPGGTVQGAVPVPSAKECTALADAILKRAEERGIKFSVARFLCVPAPEQGNMAPKKGAAI